MKRPKEIAVTDLRIGDTIAEGNGIKVTTVEFCKGSKKSKVHVNESMCYELTGLVSIK